MNVPEQLRVGTSLRHIIFATAALLTVGACSDSTSPRTSPGAATGDAVFAATLGDPVNGYGLLDDLAVRRTSDGTASNYAVEQDGIIRLVGPNGTPGPIMADLTASTFARSERGLLGLAFSLDGSTAFVNYTNLEGNTVVESMNVTSDGSFDMSSRRTIFSLDQPFPNHNGGELMVTADGESLLVFTGDGGSQGDPERVALDESSLYGKIVRLDITSADPSDTATIWASGLRNPWRAFFDPITKDLWIADVGQNMWEEINVVPFDASRGVSFGWSAFEGTVPYNEDQLARNETFDQVTPVYTYPHEGDDCSISGGAVYRGSSIDVTGTWYVFSDFCSGNVRALCVTDDRQECGLISLGRVEQSVGVVTDAAGELWVLSLTGQLVPIVQAP